MLLPAVLLVVGLSAPTVDVDALPTDTLSPRQAAVIVFLLPLAVVLLGIASAVLVLWRKSRKPLLPHEELIASLTAEEWRREFLRLRTLKR